MIGGLACALPGYSVPGEHGGYLPTPAVVIHEIHYHPARPPHGIERDDGEWVELCNPSDHAVSVAGWRLAASVSFGFPDGAEIPARGYCLLVRRPNVLRVLHPEHCGAVFGPYDGKLDNAGERLELRDAGDQLIDAVSYDDAPPWPTLADGHGHSLERLHECLDGEAAGSWEASVEARGTPGKPNSVRVELSADSGPPWVESARVVEAPGVHGFPSDRPLTVEARVVSSHCPMVVRLGWQVLRPGAYVRREDAAFRSEWETREMTRRGEQVYQAFLGPYPPRTLVRWRIQVEDELGHTASFPRSRDPEPNRAVFFVDALAAPKGLAEPAPAFFLVASRRDVAEAFEGRTARGDRYRWIGSCVFEGRVYDHVRFRLRGQSTRFDGGKRSLKLKFPRGEPLASERWKNGFFSHAHRRLNLNAARDAFGLPEALAYEVFREAGVHTPQTQFLHLRVLSTEDESEDSFGLYLAVEEIDQRFLEARGLSGGALFRMEGLPLERIAGRQDRAALRRLLAGLREGVSRDWVSQHIELERYFAFRGAARLCEVRDLGTRNQFLLRAPGDGRWQLVPSDLNGSFGLEASTGHDVFSRSVHMHFAAELDAYAASRALGDAVRRAVERVQDLAAGIEDLAQADRERWSRERYVLRSGSALDALRFARSRIEYRRRDVAAEGRLDF